MINVSSVSEVFIGLIGDGIINVRFSNWRSGDSLVYTNWYENETEGVLNGTTCVVKNTSVHGQWNIVGCLQPLPYVCKKKGMTSVFQNFR